MPADLFASVSRGFESPALDAVVVTPSDTVDLPFTSRGLYVGGTGAISVVMDGPLGPDGPGGQTVLFSAVPVGTILPIRCRRVRATGTTATLIVALQ